MSFSHFPELNSTTSPAEQDMTGMNNDEDVLYQKDAIFDAELNFPNYTDYYSGQIAALAVAATNATDSDTAQKSTAPTVTVSAIHSPSSTVHEDSTASQTPPASTPKPCTLDCGPGGGCVIGGEDGTTETCLCPLGRGGDRCEKGKWNLICNLPRPG